jgi:hypothetical protein
MANQTVTVQGGGDLNGAKLSNAATEATLLKLVSLLDQKNPGSGKKALDLERQAREGNVKSLGTSTKAGDIFSDTLDALNSETKKVNTSFSRLAGVASGILFTTLSTLGNTFRDFFLDGLDAFRQASTVGGSFNNSLIDLQRVAASTALPLDMFVETIMRNSSTLAAFGGTVTEGSKRFARLSNDLRTSDLGGQLLGMGFTVQDLNEGLADYILLQTRLGRTQSQITRNANQGTAEYLKELDALTRATGISRKSLIEEASRISLDPVIQAMMEAADPAKVATSMGLIAKVGGEELQGALKEIASGVISSDLAKRLTGLGVSLDEAKGIFEGQDPEKTRQLILKIADNLEAEGFSRDAALLQAREDFRTLQTIAIRSRELRNNDIKAAEAEQRNQEKITNALADLSNVYQTTINSIKLSLIDSGVFTKVQEGLTRIAEIFENNKDKIASFIETFVNGLDSFITNFVDNVNEAGIGNAIKDALLTIISNAGRAVFNGIKNGFLDLFRSSNTAADSGSSSNPSDNSNSLSEISEGFDLDWATLGIGLGGFAAAITALSLALPKLTPSIPVVLSFGAAIGMAGYGLGAVLSGVAPIITAASNSLDKLPDTLRKFEGLNGDTLRAVGTGISALAGPLTKLSAGGIVTLLSGEAINNLGDSLFKFNRINAEKLLQIGPAIDGLAGPITVLSGSAVLSLLSGGAISELATSLKSFSEVNPDAIINVAPALASLHSALQLFTGGEGGGILSSISGAFSTWLKGDSGIGKFAESFQAFNLIDSSNISLLVDNLEKMDSIVNLEYSAKARELSQFSEELRTFTANVRTLVNLQQVESGSTFGNLFGQTKSFEDLVNTLERVNNFDAANVESFATGIGNIKTVMNDNFATQVEGVKTFANSIDELIRKLNELATSLDSMASGRRAYTLGQINNLSERTSGSASDQSSNITMEQLRQLNTLIEQLVSISEETGQTTRDLLGATRGRFSPL